jgi:hypothetical protein
LLGVACFSFHLSDLHAQPNCPSNEVLTDSTMRGHYFRNYSSCFVLFCFVLFCFQKWANDTNMANLEIGAE